MLAVFQTSPVPFWTHTGGGQPGVILSGDTSEELAWDLVEQVYGGVFAPPTFGAGSPGGMFICDASELDPSLTRAMRFKERRFTNRWWRDQEARMAYLFGPALAGVGLADFRARFTPAALLAIYLTALIGRNYAPYHGAPVKPIDAVTALEYFEAWNYLRWLDPLDPRAIEDLALEGPIRVPDGRWS